MSDEQRLYDMVAGLNALAHVLHLNSVEHGFWDHAELRSDADHDIVIQNPSIWPEKIALIHSEASEILEADRKHQGEGKVAEECADVLIRLLDFTDARGIDIERAVVDKYFVNLARPHKHNAGY